MKLFRIALLFILLITSLNSYSQKYYDDILLYREEFKKEIVKEERAPLKVDELKYLQYYNPDSTYRVNAEFTRTENAIPFDLPTSSGMTKKFIEYGKLKFKIKGNDLMLTVYQNMKHLESDELRDYLFLPFTDPTNGEETYINGRYVDMRIGDIKDNKLFLDFNKAYNPYCAYSDGYNCPKPPEANSLKIKIQAGEMDFGRKH